jgi:hypothetical protein
VHHHIASPRQVDPHSLDSYTTNINKQEGVFHRDRRHVAAIRAWWTIVFQKRVLTTPETTYFESSWCSDAICC